MVATTKLVQYYVTFEKFSIPWGPREISDLNNSGEGGGEGEISYGIEDIHVL